MRNLEPLKRRVREDIESLFSRLSSPLKEILLYTMGGKMVRPIFCLLSCEASGGNWEDIIPVASSVELLHNFSLVHDDIEDGDEVRRGKPSLWKKFGIPHAINAGDALHALSRLSILRMKDERVKKALPLIDEVSIMMSEGQFDDLSYKGDNPDKYIEIARKKTGSLFFLSFELGLMFGGGGSGDFGYDFGIAYQIKNDITEGRGGSYELSLHYLERAIEGLFKNLPPSQARDDIYELMNKLIRG